MTKRRRVLSVIALICAFSVSGCPTIEPYGEDTKVPDQINIDVPEDTPLEGVIPTDQKPTDQRDGEDSRDLSGDEPQVCDPGDFCDDKQCGPDPCGGQCKTKCWAQQECFGWSCVEAGHLGFSCDSDGDCDSGRCLTWEDESACTVYCDEDEDCVHPDWTCGPAFGSFYCLPPCESLTCQEAGAECGTPPDGCWGTVDCGTCPEENESCDEDSWTCACSYLECAGTCCAEGDECIGGACWGGPIPCSPPCGDGEYCSDQGSCLPCCTLGAFCSDAVFCGPGLYCNAGACCALLDTTCDGIDEDCDGLVDDDFVPDDTCGVGACQLGNTPSSCVAGTEVPCQPGQPPELVDLTCDGIDDDCDGATDEEFVPDDTCGVGACQTGNTPSTCVEGVETPCQAGAPLAEEDTTCDGVDDDCDGDSDEEFQVTVTCGLGWCAQNSTPSSCIDGIESPCVPGLPGTNETWCNGVDDDCDGDQDEDYPSDDSCGLGACKSNNLPSLCLQGIEIPCIPGEPAAMDETCDGVDDDCDGDEDEDYVPDASCGKGWCRSTNVPSGCVDGVEYFCTPGQPLGGLDVSCDSVDSDCDGLTDEDADPPCTFGAPVLGAEVLFLSDAGFPSGLVTDNGDGTYSSAILDLHEPGTTGQVVAESGERVSKPRDLTVISGVPVETELFLSQSTIHGDDPRIRACLLTHDPLGAPAGPGFEAGFELDIAETQTIISAGYEGHGFYCAWVEVSPETFTEGATGTVVGWIEGLTTEASPLVAVPDPIFSPLDQGEVATTLPLGSVAPGEEFSISVVTNSGGDHIAAYNMSLSFSHTVLEVLAIEAGAGGLSQPVHSLLTDANDTGILSFNAMNPDSDGGEAMGEALELVVITFRVSPEAAPDAVAVVSGEVHELLNLLLADISVSEEMTIRGPQGSNSTGEILVAGVQVVAVKPISDPPTLLDLSPLDGLVPTAEIYAMTLDSSGDLEVRSASGALTCEVTDPGVVTEDSCLLEAVGPGVTEVSVSLEGVVGTMILRVAVLDLPLTVAPLDPELQYVFELDAVQTTTMRVIGELGDGDLLDYALDLTNRVEFLSSDSHVVAVSEDGEVISGINGSATITALGHGSVELGQTQVHVLGGDVVQITGLLVVIPAHVELDSLSPEPVPNDTAQTMAVAKVSNLLTGEGKQVQSRAILVFSDDDETLGGSRMDITGLGMVDYQSGIEGIGIVDDEGVITAVGAGETEVYAVFTDLWGDPVANNSASFSVELPPPVSVEVSLADPRVSTSVEDRAWTVLGVPNVRPLQVEVFFGDGTSLQMADDHRTRYEVNSDILEVPDVIDCLGVPACTPGEARGSGEGVGVATVTVTFPDTYLSALEGTIDIEVVGHEALLLQSLEAHTPQGQVAVQESVLSHIEGTNSWQRASLNLLDTFSDGSQVNLTENPETDYHVYLPGTETLATGVVLISDQGEVSAQGPGTVNLVGTHEGESSPPIPFQVSGASVDLVGITAYLSNGTLRGVKDQWNETLVVRGLFGDGSRQILSGPELVPDLLEMNSEDEEIATINSAAVLTARGNGETVITIDVRDEVDVGVPFDPPALSGILVNLLPAVGDLDLGEPWGLPFPDQPADAIFEVPARVNTGGKVLGGLDVEIFYDPTVLKALGVTRSEGITNALFNANVGEPGKIYFNLNPTIGTTTFGDELEVARITFKALKGPDGPMVSPIGGTIRGVIDTSGGPLGANTPRPIVAGNGEIDPPPVTVQGDSNDDEYFNLNDVLFLQWIVADPPLKIPNQTQAAQSDLFPDDSVDMKDAYFASRVLSRLAHFVSGEAVSTAPGEFDLKAWVVDRDQELVQDYVSVSFEVLPGNNLEEIQFSEPYEQTASGLLTKAILQPDGSWGTHVSGLVSQEAMGVVVILHAVDGKGESISSTAFLASPTVDPEGPFSPMFTFGDYWCVPNCAGAACGDPDGCSGACNGPCVGTNEVCQDGFCVCGFAVCAGACCSQGEVCQDGACCAPYTCSEVGAACGEPFDGCGGSLSCGDCGAAQHCDQNFSCQCSYTECDGICCGDGEICHNGACTCVPNCVGKACGDDDGCGNLCNGPCPLEDSYCQDGGCLCIYEPCGETCCGQYDECQGGVCVPLCIPNCAGQFCGADNGCGDPCDGPCVGDYQFCQSGQCACLYIQCADACCGPDQDCIGGQCL